MECQRCGQNPASVHIMQEVNGTKSEVFLCSSCAQGHNKMGVVFSQSVTPEFNIALNNFLPSIIGHSKNFINVPQVELSCPVCGLTFDEFQKVGKLGCGSCYATFDNQLAPVLSRIHGNVRYKGKAPVTNHNMQDATLERVARLKKELENSIVAEEYEKAAEIRDEIRKLESDG